MIKWLKRKIFHWVWSIEEDPKEVGRDGRVLETNSIRIDVYKGSGGIAIETTTYNKVKDTSFIGFYIIHNRMIIDMCLALYTIQTIHITFTTRCLQNEIKIITNSATIQSYRY